MTEKQECPITALAHKRAHSRKTFAPLLEQCREFERIVRDVQAAFGAKLDKAEVAVLKQRIATSLTKQPK